MMRPIVLWAALMLIIPPCSYALQQHDLEVRTEIFNDNDGTHSLTFDQVFHWKDKTTKVGLGATQTVIDESGGNRFYGGGLLEGYKKLDNADFVRRAPEEVVEENRERLTAIQADIARLEAALQRVE